ncbi:MAG: hypothetical protein JRJ12_11185 [Deltaproteobacteria bacterium]|nr:hypothetical protein [Deltaproteobacteria bacterium]MBW2072812.1 hypothetical protein [Deltaproteobacteria bacterium]
MKRYLILLLLCLLTACATGRPPGDPLHYSTAAFSVDIPRGWKRIDTSKYLLITRDSPYLEYILVQEIDVDRPFKHTSKKFKKGMLPQELAEIIIDEISSDPLVANFRVLENDPVKIKQYRGFRLVFSFQTRDGLKQQTIYHGFLIDDTFYSIRYNTSKREFLERDRESFNKVLNSFTLLSRLST